MANFPHVAEMFKKYININISVTSLQNWYCCSKTVACCQLLDSSGPASPWCKTSMLVEVEDEEEGHGLVHSGLSECSGSGDNDSMRRVPASEEHAEHKSSDEKVRLPSLARELERFSREGTVSPASRIRASISWVR